VELGRQLHLYTARVEVFWHLRACRQRERKHLIRRQKYCV